MVLKALDISKHQRGFDPQKAKQQGIETVFLRAGYGKDRDRMFVSFAAKCRQAGLRTGAYLFMTSHYRQQNGGDARLAERLQNEQLDALFETLKGSGVTSWVALDQELENGCTMGLTPAQNTDLLNKAAARVKAAGYAPCLYCSASWLKERVQAERLVMPVWAAYYYRSAAPADPDFAGASPLQAVNTGWGRYLLGLGDQLCAWQFASRGEGKKYGALSESVDRNWLYYQPEQLAEKEACRMGFEQETGRELEVTSGKNPVCEVFPAPDINFGGVALPLGERYAITHRGPVLRVAGMEGTWYKIEREGREKYVLALPDRCRVGKVQPPQPKPEPQPGITISGSGTSAQFVAAVKAYLDQNILDA